MAYTFLLITATLKIPNLLIALLKYINVFYHSSNIFGRAAKTSFYH